MELFDTNNAGNGLMTKIWGPSMWVSIHSVCAGYPMKPTNKHKQNYKHFFENIGNVLPCSHCRDSYQQFIKETPTQLNNKTLKNRASLVKWGYDIHNKVNKKLGVDYGVTYEDVAIKYEKYRAKCNKKGNGCVVPLHSKKACYKEASKKDCQIVDYETGKIFYEYAKYKNINDKYFYFWNIIENNNGKIIKGKIWDNRNKYCVKLIKWMREKGIESSNNGLPTTLELKLLICLSTNLSNNELEKIKNNTINFLKKNKK
jgi:hypothetical protein